jgi:hypothetical protein
MSTTRFYKNQNTTGQPGATTRVFKIPNKLRSGKVQGATNSVSHGIRKALRKGNRARGV